MTVEEHYVVGGIGSLVSEIVAEKGLRCRVVRCGVNAAPDGITGRQAYLRDAHGLSRERLAETARSLLEADNS